MTGRCLSYSGDRATVVLTPCWIAYLFGARTVTVDLEYADNKHASPPRQEWRTVGTRRWLSDLGYAERDAITFALDFREVGSPSRFALESGEGFAP